MKLLITGGAGFIGSHLLELLAAEGRHTVVVYDNLSSGSAANVPRGIMLKQGDVRDADALERLFAAEKFDAVIHLAAQTMVPYSIAHPLADCDINLTGALNVLENSRKYGVRKIVFSSSAAVYGDNVHIPLREEEVLAPASFYGVSKMTTEHYLRLYWNLYGINASVLRFANVYGERQGAGGEGGVVSIFSKLLAAGKPLTVYGDGRQTRDFIYAGDVARALNEALTLEGFNVINVATNKETSVNELVQAFERAAGKTIAVNYLPARPGDIERSVLDNKLLLHKLNCPPKTELNVGIARTYADYVRLREREL